MTTTKIDYQKRKNKELFKQFEANAYIGLSQAQNYSPVYKRYFDLNETNYNNINLNHKWHLSKIDASINTQKCFQCVVSDDEHKKSKNVFFKMAPLLDPYKYMSGKYDISDSLLSVPTFESNSGVHPKIMDPNNSSYVDGFFYYLSNRLLEQGFVHGIEYYGSFVGIKNNFTCNIIDDIGYLATSDFFNKNKGVLFDTQDYTNLLHDEYDNDSVKKRQHPILISNEPGLFDIEDLTEPDKSLFDIEDLTEPDKSLFDIEDLTEPNKSLISEMDTFEEFEPVIDFSNMDNINNNKDTIKSSSSCSSRTSHTKSNDSKMMFDEDEEEKEDQQEQNEEQQEQHPSNSESDEYEDVSDSSTSNSFDETLDATIPKFPIQMIAIEYCQNTLDSLVRTNELSNNELFSALMQIIMILLAYQHTYSMTHNDLHTNNVMFNPTDKKYLYYQYNKTYYKVPTFGRVFKIIDFGRAIYKYENVLFCSDSFQVGCDAATQYNTEPFMNEKKPRLDPNPSFDLCRLACSIFDYLINDMGDVQEKCANNEFIKIIVDWCLDDNGINVLYKNNGAERYPDFKLYKMIARHVHKHTPQAQLERPEFSRFAIQKQTIKKGEPVMSVDGFS
jgi:hypothetical protein